MNDKSRLIRVLCVLPTIKDCGGIEAFYFNYYSRFPKNIKVDFITHILDSKKYEQIVKERGDSIFCLPNFSLGNVKTIKNETENILKRCHYDVIHCNMANAAFLYLRLAQKYKINNRILHSHQDRYSSNFVHSIRNMPLVAWGKRYSNNNLACSQKAGRFLFGKKKFTVIYNAIDIKKYKYSNTFRNEIRNKNGIKNDEFLIGCVGRLDRQKNQELAIRILGTMNNAKAKMLLVGDGADKQKLQSLIKKCRLEKQIRFVDSTSDIFKYYSAFDTLLMPSRYEGLGMVAIEAQVAECPVIASAELPIESNISDGIKYIGLNEPVQTWAKTVELARGNRLKPKATDVKKYDIVTQLKTIIQIYNSTI